MPDPDVRVFRRPDRDQVTALVNAHAAAVLPGASASVNTVMSQFEREPGEFIVDPWVADRRVLVAQQHGSITAVALLHRYRDEADVGVSYRGSGEIRWLLFWPTAPKGNQHWQDGRAAGGALMGACLEQMQRWGVSGVHADGALPVPGVYGIPAQWPHIERLYRDSGFTSPDAAVEVIHLADLSNVPGPAAPPLPGLDLRRSVGINGTRLSAWRGPACLGHIETAVPGPADRSSQQGRVADIGNLYVEREHRRRGVGTWLLRHAAQWLRLGHADRLLNFTAVDDAAGVAFVEHNHFAEITRTRRGWRQ